MGLSELDEFLLAETLKRFLRHRGQGKYEGIRTGTERRDVRFRFSRFLCRQCDRLLAIHKVFGIETLSCCS